MSREPCTGSLTDTSARASVRLSARKETRMWDERTNVREPVSRRLQVSAVVISNYHQA